MSFFLQGSFDLLERKKALFFVPLVCVFVLSSCSAAKFATTYYSVGEKSGKMKDGIYTTERNSYRVAELSGDWRRIPMEDGDAAFHNAEKGLALTMDSVCGGREYSLETLSDSLLAGVGKKRVKTRRSIAVDGGTGLYTEYDARLDDRDFGLAAVVYRSEKCSYDFTYSASPPDFRANLGEFLDFVSGFSELWVK